MITYNYKLWFRDSEVQEIMEDWGYRVRTVRMILFDIFPKEKAQIRETILESVLRVKLCWKSEKELTDIESKLSRFYLSAKEKKKEYSWYLGSDYDLREEITISDPTEDLVCYMNRSKDWWNRWEYRHKYYMNTMFRIEIKRKFRNHIKNSNGNDVII